MTYQNINERQEPLGLKIPASVAVVGVGGVGSWVAYFLAMAGVPELWLYDGKEIATNNLNRLPVPQNEVGNNKAGAVDRLIFTVRPECRVMAVHSDFIPEVATATGLDIVNWVVAATDSLASRRQIRKWTKKSKVKYIEVAAEGEYGSATGEPATFSTKEENLLGYQSVPVHCIPCVLAASIAVNQIIHNCEMGERAVRLGWKPSPFGGAQTDVGWFDTYDSECHDWGDFGFFGKGGPNGDE